MAFRPNYRFERAERDRQKKARKDEKLKRQQERTSGDRTPAPPSPPKAEIHQRPSFRPGRRVNHSAPTPAEGATGVLRQLGPGVETPPSRAGLT